jgi:hypothetical protein
VPLQTSNLNSYLLDQDIREALKLFLRQQDGTAAIIDELPLMRGRGRADLAFVNGELCGFEIKSEGDSLVRLGMQKENYESVFEFNTLVAARKHLKLARERIPKTWGIIEAKRANGQVELVHRRQPQRNHSINNLALARLLWKNECRRVLRKACIHTSAQTPVIELWNLVQSLESEYLCAEVREALKRRQAKAVPPRTLYDDLRTTVATG